jgi:NAD(P)-dependent dehydrogenase (short-subunit alcohol dehydrogenase family)
MASGSWRIEGRTVLVTGAARGIGAEAAQRLAARGARVSLVGLEPEELEKVAARCGPEAAWFECDVTDVDSLERAVAGTVERFGGIDVAIANAGIAPIGTVRGIDPAAFERTLEINLLGLWRTIRACLPHVIERRGYVLGIASLAAAIHAPGMAAYSASKAGAEAFLNALRTEVAHLGVDVGTGYFSFIDTDLVRGADAHPAVGHLRTQRRGLLSKTYPVSAVGEAIADGVEQRRRWIVVPRWGRGLLVLRTALWPLVDADGRRGVPEAEGLFLRDVEERGTAAASAPVGAGGQAATRAREPA